MGREWNAEGCYLARAAAGFLCTAAQTLFLITGICRCPSRVTVTGHTVWKASVPQGALTTVRSTEARLTLAMASERIAPGPGRPNTTAVAGLARQTHSINRYLLHLHTVHMLGLQENVNCGDIMQIRGSPSLLHMDSLCREPTGGSVCQAGHPWAHAHGADPVT